jgi:hypothetical protein
VTAIETHVLTETSPDTCAELLDQLSFLLEVLGLDLAQRHPAYAQIGCCRVSFRVVASVESRVVNVVGSRQGDEVGLSRIECPSSGSCYRAVRGNL